MKETTTKKEEIDSMLAVLAEDVVSLMLREHENIRQELEDVGHLISDASGSLTTSFDELNNITAMQQEKLNMALQKKNAEDDVLTKTCTDLDERYKKNQLNIVTSLQFDDIVQQLTKHAQSRTQHILVMFEKVAACLEEIKKQEYAYNPEFSSQILELKQDVNSLRIELEKDNPVKQSSLAIGKTELF